MYLAHGVRVAAVALSVATMTAATTAGAVTSGASTTTTAGLPKRVPRANLVPGSVGSGEAVPEAAPQARSADEIRNRMSSFQRGVREARAAGSQNEEP